MMSDALPLTISALIKASAHHCPDGLALLAPSRPPLTYRRLQDLCDEVAEQLHRMGISRADRVAVVLGNGPELASSFLAIGATAACAPLNPEYREAEFDFYLEDLNARALVVQQGVDSPARAAARKRGVAVLEVVAERSALAGYFTLTGPSVALPAVRGEVRADDVALVLHTSGTTARPKRVPLTQANVCASAHNIRSTLQLTPDDRCLNVMPLFHIHGLIGATIATLAAGGSLVCTPGYDAGRFFVWLEEFRPTWYTAVPTVHQSILAQAVRLGDACSQTSLRLVRSSSAALPPQILEELEQTFRVPVLESYGMTEAAHQMCSNPLPPDQRKPGSVGLPAGPEVAIMDETGNLLGENATGEVVIRGPNVTTGYENNPAANAAAFTGGWFRTGDQGYRDEEGYFFITGRLKELINRGGEKIAPREVDEVLLAHPAVAEAVVFGVPHARLGEDLAAAVVLRPRALATERDLREFALERLAAHKVPHRVLIVDQVPKGPTGKLQRIGLHEKLGHLLQAKYVAPASRVEEVLAGIWQEVLELERVGVNDNFFAIGGHSLLAVRLFTKIEAAFGRSLPLSSLCLRPTIAQLAGLVQGPVVPSHETSFLAIQPDGPKPRLYFLPSLMAETTYTWRIAHHLPPDQPVYAIQPAVEGEATPQFRPLEEIAARYVEDLCDFQPEGPYCLAGYSFGGMVAYEMARQLALRGKPVTLLAILDAGPSRETVRSAAGLIHATWGYLRNLPWWMRDDLLSTHPKELWARTVRRVRWAFRQLRPGSGDSARLTAEDYFDVGHLKDDFRQQIDRNLRASFDYVPKPYPGRVTLFRSRTQPLFRLSSEDRGWGKWARGGVEIRTVPGNHESMLEEPFVRQLAESLQAALEEAQEAATLQELHGR